MIRVIALVTAASILIGSGALAQSSQYPYLSGEQYSPYTYQRPTYRSLDEYGYQTPSNGYAYPYNHGERYSPYSYPTIYPRSP